MLCSFPESVSLAQTLVGLEAQNLGRLEAQNLGRLEAQNLGRLEAQNLGQLEAQNLGKLEPRLVAPGFVWFIHGEEQFYLSNNLPEQLRIIFKPFNPRRLDEDALEVACERAQKLVRESYMLEDFVAQSYTALKNVGIEGSLHVRREYANGLETGQDRRGALLALKRVWAQDWAFEAVLERLDASGNIGVDARPSLIFAGPGGVRDAERSGQISKMLGQKIQVRVWNGRVVGLEG